MNDSFIVFVNQINESKMSELEIIWLRRRIRPLLSLELSWTCQYLFVNKDFNFGLWLIQNYRLFASLTFRILCRSTFSCTSKIFLWCFFCHCGDWQSQTSFIWKRVAKNFLKISYRLYTVNNDTMFIFGEIIPLSETTSSLELPHASCQKKTHISLFLTIWLCEWKFESVGRDINQFIKKHLLLKLMCIKRFDTVIMFPVGVSGIKCWPTGVVPLSTALH